MDKEKSLLYSLYKNFAKRTGLDENFEEDFAKDEKSTSQSGDLYSVSTPPSEESLPIEDIGIFVENVTTEVKKKIFADDIAELCCKMGYSENYNTLGSEHELAMFISRLKVLAKDYIKKLSTEDAVNDATPYVYVSRDKCKAYIIVFPPIGEGEHINMALISARLNSLKVVFGIDESVLVDIIDNRKYCSVAIFATGKPAISGEDGYIIPKVSINLTPRYAEDVHGNIDFKNLDIVNNIRKDAEICEIVYATSGTDGMSVTGAVLKAKVGRDAKMPMGKNTYLAENATTVHSAIDGEVALKDNVYFVEQTLRIKGDVDISVGNIDFVGDVHIHGDVKAGYSVKSEGSIFVDGLVEEATLIAAEDIIISKGLNGSNRGTINAKGNVRCIYLESCTVNAGGSITAENIINCEVSSNDSIYATSGKGAIIGGNLTALNNIVAKVIGSQLNRETKLTVGKSHETIEEYNMIKKDIIEHLKTFDMLDKNINFLQSLPEIPQGKQDIYAELMQQYELYKIKITDMKKRLKELEELKLNYKKCTIKADLVHSPTRITIGDSMFKVTSHVNSVTFFVDDDGVVIQGTK